MKIEPQVGMRVEFPDGRDPFGPYVITDVSKGKHLAQFDNGRAEWCRNHLFCDDLVEYGGVVKFPKAHYIKLFKEAYGR